MKKQVYLFKRNGGVYYAQFTDPLTGRRSTAHSTGTKDKILATEKAFNMLYMPRPDKKQNTVFNSIKNALDSNILSQTELLKLQEMLGFARTSVIQNDTPLIQWLTDIWTYEKSEYVQDKLSHGKKISKRYCYDQTVLLKYWKEFFDDSFLLEKLTTEKLQDFEKYLWSKEIQKRKTIIDESTGKKSIIVYKTKLSTTTRNNILKCASIVFEWATRKKILAENPCKALTAYSIKIQNCL